MLDPTFGTITASKNIRSSSKANQKKIYKRFKKGTQSRLNWDMRGRYGTYFWEKWNTNERSGTNNFRRSLIQFLKRMKKKT